ncbi:hypothetical protein FB461_0781 [Rarobacter faecitabidus]|uniref:Uncharacterized protein n=2 Tax=Rarobacter faecitabidus TaxID=13243 RepID=A0A542ZV99_RARFA|nr:hypothetical protein FB461_0781 [Rarobacter faecitabidus]
MTTLMWLCLAPLAALTGWAVYFAVKHRAVILRQLWLGAAIEGLLIVQLVTGLVLYAQGSASEDVAVWLSYAIVGLLLLPGGAVMAFVERTRFSSIVMAILGASLMVMQWRMTQEWQVIW